MTRGSRRMSRGRPAAMTWPWSRTTMRWHRPMTRVMSCSMTSRVMPRAAQLLHQGHEVLGLPGIEAGGGFVHEQELRRLGQGPGDFQAPLIAVGQGLGGFGRPCLPGPPVPGSSRACRWFSAWARSHPGQRQEGREHSHLLVEMEAGEDVVQHRHAPEELDILEGAGQAQAGPAVGGQAHHLRAGQPDAAGAGGQKAVNQIEAGGLAGAVGADQTDDLARRPRQKRRGARPERRRRIYSDYRLLA